MEDMTFAGWAALAAFVIFLAYRIRASKKNTGSLYKGVFGGGNNDTQHK